MESNTSTLSCHALPQSSSGTQILLCRRYRDVFVFVEPLSHLAIQLLALLLVLVHVLLSLLQTWVGVIIIGGLSDYQSPEQSQANHLDMEFVRRMRNSSCLTSQFYLAMF